jgi:ribosomal-protein-alanine N-acetyltransferase
MTFEVTTYSRYDREGATSLLNTSKNVHRHIDWRQADEWLDDPGMTIRLARAGGQVVGCLAAAPSHNGASWLRLIAVADDQSVPLMLDAMWPQVRLALAACDVKQIGVLAVCRWLISHLPALGFRQVNQVITMRRIGSRLPAPLRADLKIRPATPADRDAIVAVDNAAFAPLWQYSARDLRDASRVVAHFTLAELNGRVVGYQLSTLGEDGAHLVRLATSPSLQGMGVGSMLLGEVVEHFLKRHCTQVTVNTQADNRASQQLYRRFGFTETGQSVPVWAITI